MRYHYLEVWIEEYIAYVKLNIPSERNIFLPELSQELLDVANEFIDHQQIKVVVLGANGRDFSLGIPPKLAQNDLDEAYTSVVLASKAIEQWSRIPYPIIVAINGQCASLGLSLACVGDIRYASERAIFYMPEATWGIVPAGGITQRLPKLIGKGPSMNMLLGGEHMQANQALDFGLINQLVHTDVWEEACNQASKLAEMSTLAMQYAKECLLKGSEMTFEQALRLELDIYMLLQTSEDRIEGVQAFLEKRKPQFKGS